MKNLPEQTSVDSGFLNKIVSRLPAITNAIAITGLIAAISQNVKLNLPAENKPINPVNAQGHVDPYAVTEPNDGIEKPATEQENQAANTACYSLFKKIEVNNGGRNDPYATGPLGSPVSVGNECVRSKTFTGRINGGNWKITLEEGWNKLPNSPSSCINNQNTGSYFRRVKLEQPSTQNYRTITCSGGYTSISTQKPLKDKGIDAYMSETENPNLRHSPFAPPFIYKKMNYPHLMEWIKKVTTALPAPVVVDPAAARARNIKRFDK